MLPLAMTLSVALTLVACGGGSSETSQSPTATVKGGTLVWGENQEATEMDPSASYFDGSWRVQRLIYETLTTTDDTLQIVPGVAESWEQPTPTTYVFKLRPGETFSNGRPLVANDVVGSLKRLLDPKAPSWWSAYLGPVKTISAVDDSTVKVTLSEPYTPFLAALANVTAAILPMKELRDGSFDPTKEMLGSGPFVVTDHKPDESWTFERNAYYWREGYPIVDEVVMRVIPDDSARIAALRDGSIDVACFETPDAPDLLAGIPDVDVVVQDLTDHYGLILNGAAPDSPFRDMTVRQAIALGLDRQHVIDLALAGTGEVTAQSPVGLPDAADPSKIAFLSRDVDRAKELLKEAGAEGLSITLLSPSYLSTFSPIAQILEQDLAEIGVKVAVSQPEEGAWLNDVYMTQPGNFEASLDYFAGYGDATLSLLGALPEQHVGDGFIDRRAPGPEIEELVREALALPPGSERAAVIQEACDLSAEQANIIALPTRVRVVAYRTDNVAANIQALEGYGITLRHIEEFALTGAK